MNRIDELFIKSGGYIEIDKDGNRWTYSQECDPDTFAELIIRECIDISHTNGDNLDYIEKHFWSE